LDCVLTTKIDVWALGCILLQFVTGEEPFAGVLNEIAVSIQLFDGVSPLAHACKVNPSLGEGALSKTGATK